MTRAAEQKTGEKKQKEKAEVARTGVTLRFTGRNLKKSELMININLLILGRNGFRRAYIVSNEDTSRLCLFRRRHQHPLNILALPM
jgi:hypothetical protein